MTDRRPVADLLDAFRDATAASSGDASPILRALEPEIRTAAHNRHLATTSDEGKVVPLFRRTAWLAAAAAAALLLAFLLWPRPEPEVTVSARLEAGTDGGHFQIGESVRLWYTGEGVIEGTSRRPALDWDAGQLRVEVDPAAQVELSVRTREGQVRVVGTVFSVTRDALGTTVAVERGRVAVSCNLAAATEIPSAGLGEGESLVCLPVTAGGLLGRARALEEAGAPPETILATLDRGLTLEAGAPLASELRALRIPQLARIGRSLEALDAALAYLAGSAPTRRDQIVRLASRLAVGLSDCAQARPYLDALATLGDAEAARRREDCATQP